MNRWNQTFFYGLFISCWLPHVVDMPWWSSVSVVSIATFSFLAHKGYLPYFNKLVIVPIIIATAYFIWREHKTFIGPDPATPLLLTLAALKLHEIKKHRDSLVFLFICLLIVMFALLFYQNILMTLYMITTVILVTIGGVALHTPRIRLKEVLKSGPKLVLRDLLFCLPIFLMFFFFFPRFQTPWGQMMPATGASVGFGDEFNPGEIANLAQSEELAFRVQFSGQRPDVSQLYWRGVVLSQTDGWLWRRKSLFKIDPTTLNANDFQNIVQYQLTLEPRFEKILFSLDYPIELDSATPQPQQSVFKRSNAVYETRTPAFVRRPYNGTSQASGQMPYTLIENEKKIFLQLPVQKSPAIEEFVRPWVNLNPEDKIKAVLDHFATQGFQYSLNVPAMGTIDEFLLQQKVGFCEHYAASFAFLMRYMGVPARVVTGFHGGDYNEYSDEVLVLDKHAHAWTEVWIQNIGWQRVDPTTAVNRNRIYLGQVSVGSIGQGNWLTQTWYETAMIFDALNSRYINFLLNYDFEDQKDALDFLPSDIKKWQMLFGLITFAFVFMYLLNLYLKRSKSTKPKYEILYHDFFKKLAAYGYKKQPQQGPLSYFNEVVKHNEAASQKLTDIFSQYVLLKYGRPAQKNQKCHTDIVTDVDIATDAKIKQQLKNFDWDNIIRRPANAGRREKQNAQDYQSH